MKFNWGTKVTILYSSFVVMMLSLVFISTNMEHNLVADDYYQQDLEYEQKIKKLNNSKALSIPLSIIYDNSKNQIVFNFPSNIGTPTGTITLYRPSDAKEDKVLTINVDSENKQIIKTDDLLNGMWQANVDWVVSTTEYYNKQVIVIN